MKDTRFKFVNEVQEAVMRVLSGIPVEAFQNCYNDWKKCWSRCIASQVDYLKGIMLLESNFKYTFFMGSVLLPNCQISYMYVGLSSCNYILMDRNKFKLIIRGKCTVTYYRMEHLSCNYGPMTVFYKCESNFLECGVKLSHQNGLFKWKIRLHNWAPIFSIFYMTKCVNYLLRNFWTIWHWIRALFTNWEAILDRVHIW